MPGKDALNEKLDELLEDVNTRQRQYHSVVSLELVREWLQELKEEAK